MVSFRPLELADLPAIRPFFEQSGTRLCDGTSVMMMWRKLFASEFAVGNDALFIKQTIDGQTAFMAPVGGDFYEGAETILAYCRAHSLTPRLAVVSGGELALLRERYDVTAEPVRDWFDYLYESSDLIELPGRRYHGQRNHISRFDRQYPGHDYRPLEDTEAAKAFIDRFYLRHPPSGPVGQTERELVREVLDHYGEYRQLGGVLTVNGDIVSLSIGEIVGDTLFVHIEKADTSYAGAYQKTVNLFARTYGRHARYINREEDMGVEGLRTSKLSYHPAALLEKYMAEIH